VNVCPTAWALQVLKLNPHLLVWRDVGIAMREGNVEGSGHDVSLAHRWALAIKHHSTRTNSAKL